MLVWIGYPYISGSIIKTVDSIFQQWRKLSTLRIGHRKGNILDFFYVCKDDYFLQV